jgi:hypothetical protein
MKLAKPILGWKLRVIWTTDPTTSTGLAGLRNWMVTIISQEPICSSATMGYKLRMRWLCCQTLTCTMVKYGIWIHVNLYIRYIYIYCVHMLVVFWWWLESLNRLWTNYYIYKALVWQSHKYWPDLIQILIMANIRVGSPDVQTNLDSTVFSSTGTIDPQSEISREWLDDWNSRKFPRLQKDILGITI